MRCNEGRLCCHCCHFQVTLLLPSSLTTSSFNSSANTVGTNLASTWGQPPTHSPSPARGSKVDMNSRTPRSKLDVHICVHSTLVDILPDGSHAAKLPLPIGQAHGASSTYAHAALSTGSEAFSGVKFRTHLSRYTTFNLFWKAWLHHNIPPHDPECKLPAYWASSPFRPLKADRVRYWHLELDAGIWLVLQRLRLRLPQARGRFAKMFLLRRNVLFFGAWKYPANSSAITLLVLYLLSIVTNMNISFLLGFNDLNWLDWSLYAPRACEHGTPGRNYWRV